QFAHDIHLHRPQEDYQLEIRVTKLTLNAPIPADRFDLAQPPNSILVRVGEDDTDATPSDKPAIDKPAAPPEAKP
ncbi:MAG: hypothetical protein WBF35_02100, partial [Candidatus Acidiferrales bacterium]